MAGFRYYVIINVGFSKYRASVLKNSLAGAPSTTLWSIVKLRNIMDSEAPIDLTITRKQGTFNFTEPEPDPEE